MVQNTIEGLTDQARWIFDQGPALILKREDACAETEGAHALWVTESDCIVLSDHSGTMQQFSSALDTRLKPEMKPRLAVMGVFDAN